MIKMFTTKNLRKRIAGAAMALATALLSASGLFAQISNPAPYCGTTSGFTTNCTTYGWGFDLVQVNTLNFQTQGCRDENYLYYNNGPTTNLSGGVAYTIRLGAPNPNTWATLGFGAWIDYNQDGDFADAGEFLGTMPTSNAQPARSSRSFTVPCAAKAGKTRMRVSLGYFFTPGAGNSCGQPTYYNQFRDFDVTILQASSPAANFAIPDSVFELASTTFLNLTPTGTHQWSTSVDGLTSIVSTVTDFNYAFPSPGNYQVRLTTTNCSGPATVTKNVTVLRPTTAPNVEFVATQNKVNFLGSVVSVDLFDLSQSGPYQWDWELLPGPAFVEPWFISVGSSASKNISVSFFDVGVYEVCLTATNSRGSTKRCKKSYIEIGSPGGGAKYDNIMCKQQASTLDSGIISDDGGPNGNYANNMFCPFLIDPCGKGEITLVFDGTTQIYSGDRLDIYDGTSSSAPLITSVTNVLTGTPNPVVAKSGKMYMEWITNNVTVGRGFNAKWSSKQAFVGPVVADFKLADTIYQCSGGTSVQFVNSSNAPNDADFEWIFEYDPNIDYCATLPCYFDDDSRNPVYDFFQTQTYNVRLVVNSCAGSDTVVKSFVHAATNNRPLIDFTVDKSIIPVNEVVQLVNTTKAGCSGYWELFPLTYRFVNGTDSTSQIAYVQLTGPALYAVTYTARNDNGTSVRTKSDFVRAVEYCVPVVSIPNIADVGINEVNFININNESTSGVAPGYTDYSKTLIAEAVIGAVYDLTVSRLATVNPANRRVWIDFNRDGDFLDAGELVGSENAAQTLSYTTKVTIPGVDQDVVPGLTRMRVSTVLGSQSNTSCGPNSVGEYEDYGVNLILDRMPPFITLLGNDTVVVEKGGTYVDAGATATDNVQGDITSKIVTDNQVDLTQTGVYIITYTVRDGSGNFAVSVRRTVIVKSDITAPMVTLNGASPLVHSVGTPFMDPGVTAIDMPGSNNISNLAVRTGMFDENMVGTYMLYYTVTDAFGNSAMVMREVQVIDNIAPVINLNGPDPMMVQVNSTFMDPTTATDNYDQNVGLMVTGSVNVNVFGDYRITYNAMDANGNMAMPVTRTFRVGDGIAPVLNTLPGTEVMMADVNDFNFREPAVTATDNFYPAVQVIRSGNFDITKLGTYMVTYTATDGSGNVSTWNRTINVVDRIAPRIISAPANVFRWTMFNRALNVAAADNYNQPADFIFAATTGTRIEVISDNVDETTEGVYQVVYSAIDGAGNISEPFARVVIVAENTTGINDMSFANGISMYPNPTSGIVNLAFNGISSDNLEVSVMNMVGALVSSAKANTANGNVISLDLRELAAGVYTVTITDGNRTAVKKLNITR